MACVCGLISPAYIYKVSEPKMLCDEWCDPKGLSKSVKHTKRPSALAYDEMNIHVKRNE